MMMTLHVVNERKKKEITIVTQLDNLLDGGSLFEKATVFVLLFAWFFDKKTV